MRRLQAPPKPWEQEWWWHSKPVAKSLHILAELGALVSESGRTDKTPGFLPFYVVIKVTPLTPAPDPLNSDGKPYLPGDTFYVTSRRELHAVAEEALRRAEQARAEEAP